MKAALAAVEGPRTLVGKGHGAGHDVVRMSVWGVVLSSRKDDAAVCAKRFVFRFFRVAAFREK